MECTSQVEILGGMLDTALSGLSQKRAKRETEATKVCRGAVQVQERASLVPCACSMLAKNATVRMHA
eukprot:3443418-Pleurochrysis_carterae.AAC.2